MCVIPVEAGGSEVLSHIASPRAASDIGNPVSKNKQIIQQQNETFPMKGVESEYSGFVAVCPLS